MIELDDYLLSELSQQIIDEIALEKNISKKYAKTLFLNALSYNVVMNTIRDMVDILLEENKKGKIIEF